MHGICPLLADPSERAFLCGCGPHNEVFETPLSLRQLGWMAWEGLECSQPCMHSEVYSVPSPLLRFCPPFA